ncbi:ABC transporter permease [Nakamurella aerolata]|uniref:ABC transporter permease n=1 Tax=Nakamurella aerolata TaxID=1656892 RepID=A0A849A121_9ACTN|nr:ABC transporter permease [Nakamurella aerolata]NNG34339.1 ABC transporter permease [Nakamurella aerolata]
MTSSNSPAGTPPDPTLDPTRDPARDPGPDEAPDRPRNSARGLLIVGGSIVGLVLLTGIVSFFWTPFDTGYTDLANAKAGPGTAGHLLGTDRLGRDIASSLMAGARTTLYVGLVAVGIAALIGTPLGILAAMLPPRWSQFVMRCTDVMLAFPALLLALMFAAIWGGGITTAMVAIGIASIPSFIRVVRSGALVVMTSDYVQAARVAGRSRWGIAVSHVLRNVAGLVIVQASVSYAIAILAEAGLSYLGFGAGLTTPSWGLMLQESQSTLRSDPLITVWPAVAIALAVLGFNLLGDGLRDRFDPRRQR